MPILYYHRVQPVPQTFSKWTKAKQKRFLEYDALPKAFVAQLDWLVANGYTTILPGDLAAHWDHGTPLPPKPVIITFDDGSRSWTKRVMQDLQQRGMVAEFYLTLDAIKADAIDWSDIRKLVAAGNGIGAHDVHHVQIAGLPGWPRSAGGDDVEGDQRHPWRHPGQCRGSPGLDVLRRRRIRQDADASRCRCRVHDRPLDQPRDRPDGRRGAISLRVVRIGANDDVVDPRKQTLVPGLPTFAARMRGVSDLK